MSKSSDVDSPEVWLIRLQRFGIRRRDLRKHQKALQQQFGHEPSVRDTVWRMLNSLLMRTDSQDAVRYEMARLLVLEGKSLESHGFDRLFLGHEELREIREMRQAGSLDLADELLLWAIPSEAVLDELRKNASLRAREAKREEDWEAVARHLDGYSKLAEERRDECIKLVNAEPPPHTSRDQKLLEEALEMLGQ